MELRTLDMDIAAAQQKLKEQSVELKNLQVQLKEMAVKKSHSTLCSENSQLLNKIADVTIKIGIKNDRNIKIQVCPVKILFNKMNF